MSRQIEIPISPQDVAYMQMCEFEYAGLAALVKQFACVPQDSQYQVDAARFKELMDRHDRAYSKYRLAHLEIANKYPCREAADAAAVQSRIDYLKEVIVYDLLKFQPRVPQFQDCFGAMYPECVAALNDRENKPKLAVRSVTFVVTEQCNLRCSYCYQHAKNDTRMTKQTAEAFVDLLFEEDLRNNRFINQRDAAALILDFVGGEPLLEIDLIDHIVDYFRYKAVTLNHRWAVNYMISMTTNGILFNTPKVKQFMWKNRHKVSLGITIDGNKALHDACRRFTDGSPSYDIVLKSVRAYKAMVDRINTKVALAPTNIEHLSSAIIHLADEAGIDEVYANCVFEQGWDYSHARIMYHELKKLADWIISHDRETSFCCSLFDEGIGKPLDPDDNANWCGGTGAMISFTPDGNTQPCLRYTHFNLNDKQPELRIGNLEFASQTMRNTLKRWIFWIP